MRSGAAKWVKVWQVHDGGSGSGGEDLGWACAGSNPTPSPPQPATTSTPAAPPGGGGGGVPGASSAAPSASGGGAGTSASVAGAAASGGGAAPGGSLFLGLRRQYALLSPGVPGGAAVPDLALVGSAPGPAMALLPGGAEVLVVRDCTSVFLSASDGRPSRRCVRVRMYAYVRACACVFVRERACA